MSPSFRAVLLAMACLAPPMTVGAQVTFEFITPTGTFEQAVGISPNGDYVVGAGGLNGFLWSQAGGLETGFGAPIEAWGVSNDGDAMVGTSLDGNGKQVAAVWTATGGMQLLGNFGGATGCDAFLSHLFDLSWDGSTAVGMSWQGCRTSPMRWRPGTGLTLMAKQDPNSSARASRLSADGQVAGGWDQGLPTGQGFTRRACLWLDDDTQVFPATNGANPNGYGEVSAVSASGGWCAGNYNMGNPFRWSTTGGLEVLPNISGIVGGYYANGISDDGSVVVGVRVQQLSAIAFIWTEATGTVRLSDYLTANGATGFSASDIANATDISADGKTICGWGGARAWVVQLGEPDPWDNLGGGTPGIQGVPQLTGIGSMTSGSLLTLDLVNGPPSDFILLWIATSSTPVDVLGGTVFALPFEFEVLLATDPSGSFTGSTNLPPVVPSGSELIFQYICQDPTTFYGLTLSNAVRGTTP